MDVLLYFLLITTHDLLSNSVALITGFIALIFLVVAIYQLFFTSME